MKVKPKLSKLLKIISLLSLEYSTKNTAFHYPISDYSLLNTYA